MYEYVQWQLLVLNKSSHEMLIFKRPQVSEIYFCSHLHPWNNCFVFNSFFYFISTCKMTCSHLLVIKLLQQGPLSLYWVNAMEILHRNLCPKEGYTMFFLKTWFLYTESTLYNKHTIRWDSICSVKWDNVSGLSHPSCLEQPK